MNDKFWFLRPVGHWQALVESFFFLGAAWFHYAAVPSGTCKLFSELEMIDCKGLAGPKADCKTSMTCICNICLSTIDVKG